MPTRDSKLRLALPLLLLLLPACGGGGGGNSPSESPRTASVMFAYLQPTTRHPDVDFSQCEGTGGEAFFTHIHPGWSADPPNIRLGMAALGPERWEVRTEVPVDQITWVQVHDPNSCLGGGSPYVPARELYANGVLLGTLPGSVIVDQMLFRVAADGTVSVATR